MAAPRWRAWAGIAGPTAFIASWWALGSIRDGYSPVDDPISRLAALDAATRPAMTVGFLAFAAGVGAYIPLLRTRSPGGASRAATITAAATLGIAALPLGGRGGDQPHALAAGIAYAALAATPLFAARASIERGDRIAAVASIATGMAVAATLSASMLVPHATGLTQRLGLTLGDLWIIASAATALRARDPRHAPHAVDRAGHGP